jgi:hypothetical protein
MCYKSIKQFRATHVWRLRGGSLGVAPRHLLRITSLETSPKDRFIHLQGSIVTAFASKRPEVDDTPLYKQEQHQGATTSPSDISRLGMPV